MNFSLADHTVVLSNNNYNIIIGNGSSTESINITFANDNYSYTMASDGTGTLNKNYMRNGSITISLQQTNPFNKSLTNMYEGQMASNPTDIATITVKDSNGNINGTFEGGVITKNPDYTANPEVSSRDYVIIFKNGKLI